MTRLIYDGTFEGLLTAVFDIYALRLEIVNLQKAGEANAAIFEETRQIVTDNARAARVLKGLKEKLSSNGVQRAYIAHLAGIANEENNIVGFIRHVFDSSQNIEGDYANRYVSRISEVVKMMRREKHRMEAFIRFQKLKDDIYYAGIEPDFNVLPLLIKHFKNRYADQKWLIYDIKRKYGINYDLHDVEYISMDFSSVRAADKVVAVFDEEEETYQHLWKNYFKSVNITSRKNTKLHIRHIPKRYWKHLTEKI